MLKNEYSSILKTSVLEIILFFTTLSKQKESCLNEEMNSLYHEISANIKNGE